MARLVTLGTATTSGSLFGRTLQRANLEKAANSNLFTPAEVIDNINEGIAEYWQVLGEFPDQRYAMPSVTFNTSASKDTYQIGAGLDIPIQDFWKPCGLDVMFGVNLVNTSKKFMWVERNRYKNLYYGWTYNRPTFYALVGNAIKFIPLPSGQFNITLWYLPTSPVLVNPSDTFDGIQGFEEAVVCSAAIKLLTKQERFDHAMALASERGRIYEQMRGILGTRDVEQPERVTDVMTSDDGWLGRQIY